MAQNSDGDEFSLLAFVLVILASIFVLLDGLVVLALGAAIGQIAPEVGNAVDGLGAFAVLLALVLGGMAYALYRDPASSRLAGVVVMLVSFVSLFVGGGFFLGLLLGIAGGIAAIFFEPETDLSIEVDTDTKDF
jgi:hypothetical protein